jgi:hypothetical protein
MSLAAVAVMFLAAAPQERVKPRVCVVDYSDASNQLPQASVLGALEPALRRPFVVVPNRRVLMAARAERLPRSAWLEATGLSRLSKRLDFEVALAVRGLFAFGSWTIYLTAFDARTGEVLTEAHVLLSRPRLPESRARDLVTTLASALSRREAPVEATAPEPATGSAEPEEAEEPPVDVWEQATEALPKIRSSPESLVEALSTETRVEAGGQLTLEHYGFFSNGTPDQVTGRDDVDAAVRLKVVHPRATVFVSLLARVDFADPSRNRFEPDDAWLELNFPGVTVKAGRFVASWGAASLYNPSDVLNPVDLRDPLDPEKWGTLMLRVAVTLGPVTLEGSYLPVPEMHRIPLITGISAQGALMSRSRWVRGSVDVDVSAPVTFAVSPMAPPGPRPSNSQFALRALLSAGGVDVSLGYAWLVDRFPSAVLEAVPEAGVPLDTTVHVDWLFRRLHVLTFDAERTFGKLRLAGEVAAFLTRDLTATNRNVTDPYLVLDVGGDYQTGNFLGEQQLHFFLEFVTTQALVGRLPTEGLDLLRAPFRLSLLGRISWEVTSDLKVDLNATTSLERFDVLLSPRISYSFFDRVKARVGVDLLLGAPTGGFFGPWRDNSRFTVALESRF